MALSEVLGQERAIGILRGFLDTKRVPHALLFTGDEGIGKRLTALNFAKALNCQSSGMQPPPDDGLFQAGPGPDLPTEPAPDLADACDHCPSCTKTDQGNHPDVSLISPEGDGGQITVSAVRRLEESLSYKPFEGIWKIAVIDSADRLNPSAANAFLQTLEEPSAQSILILISGRPDLILPTLRSRCQRVHFSPLPADEMSRLLVERFNHDNREQARLLGMLSGGRLGQALRDDLIEQRDIFFSLLQGMLDNSAEEPWQDRQTMEDWLEWSQLFLRDLAVFRSTGKADLLINSDLSEQMQSLSERTDMRSVLNLAQDLYNIKKKMIYNLNKQLTFNYVSLLLRKYLLQHRQR